MGLFAPTIRRGQAKPYTSVPRIDWTHPLAKGLTVYAFDLGGAYIDLVGGQLGTNHSTNGRGVYKQGQGLKFPTTGWVNLPTSKGATNLAATLPYSVAMATNYVGAPNGTVGSIIVGNAAADNSTDGGIAFTTAASGGIAGAFNNGANQVAFTTALANNGTYQSWVIVPTAATTANYYANGTLDKSATGLGSTTFSIVAKTGQVMFNTCTNNAVTFGGGINGYVPYFAAWNRQITAHEARMLHDSPYDFLIWPEEEQDAIEVGSAAGPVSVNVTGVAATSAAGAVTVSGKANVSITGVAATGSAGTVAVAIPVSATLTGVASTTAAGTPTVTGFANVTLTGVASAGAAGTPTITGFANVSVNGVAATGSIGTLAETAAANVTLTGVASTSAAGTPTVTGFANVTLTGVASASQVGTITVSVGGATSVNLTGVAATSAAGTPTVTGFANVSLTGAAATAQVGTLTASAAANATLTGVQASSAVGTLTETGACNVTLAGVLATCAAGDITVSVPTGVSVTLDGVSATCSVGVLSTNLDLPIVIPPSNGGAGFASGPYTGAFRKKRKKKTEDEELAELAEQLRAIPFEIPKAVVNPPVIYDRPLISAFIDEERNKTIRLMASKAAALRRRQEDDDESASLLLLS